MQDYKELMLTKPCEVCAALRQSESYKQAYRRAANDAVDYLLFVYHAQQGGQLAEVDGERVVLLLDTLLSIEAEEKGCK